MELPRYFYITADPEGVLPRSAGRNARVSYVAITTLFTNEPEIAPKRASREVVLGLVLATRHGANHFPDGHLCESLDHEEP